MQIPKAAAAFGRTHFIGCSAAPRMTSRVGRWVSCNHVGLGRGRDPIRLITPKLDEPSELVGGKEDVGNYLGKFREQFEGLLNRKKKEEAQFMSNAEIQLVS